MKELKGILPATVSPNRPDGSFDTEAMRKIVRHQIDAGSDGVYVCGGTGEGLLMSREDRELALETTLEEVNGEATVIAHVGAFQTGRDGRAGPARQPTPGPTPSPPCRRPTSTSRTTTA